ncbi:MAG: acyloxyacyl hydrolase [bacterium]
MSALITAPMAIPMTTTILVAITTAIIAVITTAITTAVVIAVMTAITTAITPAIATAFSHNTVKNGLIGFTILLSTLVLWPGNTYAERNSQSMVSTRYGLASILGNTYDPVNDIRFFLISGFALYDYERVWHHPAPDPLRFKVEGALGATTSPCARIMASVGIEAFYYLDTFAAKHSGAAEHSVAAKQIRPYAEAGVGIIYSDFQVEGQGLRINFNPQAGLGLEFLTEPKTSFFTTLRLHHISNGHLYKYNRGVNSISLVVGYFFP